MIRPNYFEQLGGVVKRFLALEPAVVAGFIRSIILLAGTLGLVIPQEVEGRAVAIFTALVVVVELGLGIYTRTRVTPTAKVVEQIADDGETVVAGPANTIVTPGDDIRLFDEALPATGTGAVTDPDAGEVVYEVDKTPPPDGYTPRHRGEML